VVDSGQTPVRRKNISRTGYVRTLIKYLQVILITEFFYYYHKVSYCLADGEVLKGYLKFQ